jgi:hypothetical protein
MDNTQSHHERHERNRQKRRARRRQIEAAFAQPRKPSAWPFWFLAGGIVLSVAALLALVVAAQIE